jgi:uncharacterized protein
MLTELGQVEAIFRYPVKSMAGERLETAELGWHGIEGDRRFAFLRINDRSGFPWLSASKLPDLVRFAPHGNNGQADLPTHIRTPEGVDHPILSEELDVEIERRYGAPVQMMQLKHGVFDEAAVSVINVDTIEEISRVAGLTSDARRFRPNLVIRSAKSAAFEEDKWVGGVLTFGEGDNAPAIAVTMRDIRCAMLNLDPDTARPSPEMMKAVVRVHENTAGVYGTVTRTGQLAAGQRIFFQRNA